MHGNRAKRRTCERHIVRRMGCFAEVIPVRQLANCITISRIAAAVALIFITPLSFAFYVVYSYCGITDVADGMIARKTQTQSKTGAVLDSIADIVFLIVVLAKLLPMVLPSVPKYGFVLVAVIAAIRIAAYVIGAVKFHRFAALHTVCNKVTGAALFFVPYLLYAVDIRILTLALCLLAGLSAVEELLCEIKAKQYDPNVRTIFAISRNDSEQIKKS